MATREMPKEFQVLKDNGWNVDYIAGKWEVQKGSEVLTMLQVPIEEDGELVEQWVGLQTIARSIDMIIEEEY